MLDINTLFKNFTVNDMNIIVINKLNDYSFEFETKSELINFIKIDLDEILEDISFNVELFGDYEGDLHYLSENHNTFDKYVEINGYNIGMTIWENITNCKIWENRNLLEGFKNDILKYLSDPLLKKEGYFDFTHKDIPYQIEYVFGMDKILYVINRMDSKFIQTLCDYSCDDDSFKRESDLKHSAVYSINNLRFS